MNKYHSIYTTFHHSNENYIEYFDASLHRYIIVTSQVFGVQFKRLGLTYVLEKNYN